MMKGVRTPAPSLAGCALPPKTKAFCRRMAAVQCSNDGRDESPQSCAALVARREIFMQSAVLALGKIQYLDTLHNGIDSRPIKASLITPTACSKPGRRFHPCMPACGCPTWLQEGFEQEKEGEDTRIRVQGGPSGTQVRTSFNLLDHRPHQIVLACRETRECLRESE